MAPKMEPKWSQNGSRIGSEAVREEFGSLPKNRLKNASKIVDFGGPLGSLWGAFWGTFWSHFQVFLATSSPEGFWEPFGAILGSILGRFGEDFGTIF